jgi:uncharacterized protein
LGAGAVPEGSITDNLQGGVMELSKKERIILINQYEILKHLDAENASRYEELIEILRSGYEIFYSKVGEWVNDRTMPVEEGKFVLNVLDLYRAIEAYKRDNPADEEVVNHLWSSFRGFDGNSESNYFAFTQFLIYDQNKWSEQRQYEAKTDRFNSHMPVASKYRKMLDAWGGGEDRFQLSREKIIGILNS